MKVLTAIPLYNKQHTITRAIQSVLDQSVDCEVVVVNDGSTDQSEALAKKAGADQIRILSQENKGVSATRNRAIQYALDSKYDFLAFLDADDYWLPNHLEALLTLMQEYPSAQVAGANYKHQINQNRFTSTAVSGGSSNSQILNNYFEYTYLDSPLNSSNLLLRLDKKPLYYNEKLTHGEDTDYNIRLGIHKSIVFSTQVTVVIDSSATGGSAQVDVANRHYLNLNKYEKFVDEQPGLKKYLDLNRYALAIEYLMGGETEKAKSIVARIDKTNLTKKQYFLLTLSGNQLRKLKGLQGFLAKRGLRWRTGS